MSLHLHLPFFALASLFQDPTPAPESPKSPEPPAPPRGLVHRDIDAFGGFTLFAPLASGSTHLINLAGQEVHRWDTNLPPAAMAYLLDNGHLLRSIRVMDNPRFAGGGLGGRMLELDWDGNTVWDYTHSDENRSTHHDLDILPNGNILAIQWEYVSPAEAVALGRDPKHISTKGWWPDAIIELQRDGKNGAKVVWEWHAKDHLIQDFDRAKKNYGSVVEHPERLDINLDHRDKTPLTAAQLEERERVEREMRALGYTGGDVDEDDADEKPEPDWMHTNGIDYHPELDLIVASSAHMCEVFIIDHSTTTEQARGSTGGRWGRGGDLLYRWGNPKNYGLGAESDRTLHYQHDPQWIPAGFEGAGRLLVFNNGQERDDDASWSTIDELILPLDPKSGFQRLATQPFGPTSPAWSYAADDQLTFYSAFISGCQRLPNGNTLICSGAQGRFFEITRAGRVVWEYLNPFGGEIPVSFGLAAERTPKVDSKAVFQATRLSPDHPALRGRELKPR